MGMRGAAAVLTAVGAVLAGASLAVHLPEVKAASDALAPGAGGAALLLLAQLAYAPNAIIWAVAYTLGPGFAFGAGTVIAPTGSVLGAVPAFPMLAALPSGAQPGGPAWVPVLVLATPYLAGVFAGIVTVRIAPTPVIEAAPLWGFTAGAAAPRRPAWRRRSRAARSVTAAWPWSVRPASRSAWSRSSKSALPPP